MNRLYNIFVESQLDGFNGAGLFARLARPYAPAEMIDSRSMEEFLASDEWVSRTPLNAVMGARLAQVAEGNGVWGQVFEELRNLWSVWGKLSWQDRLRLLSGPGREEMERYRAKAKHQSARSEAKHSPR